MKRRIAYEGNEFTIEWYCDSKGHSQALEYFNEQPKDKQRKLLNLFRLIGEQGKIFDETKFRNEGDGIYAFKPQPDRYLCFFFKGKKIIVTNAFIKKTQKLPQSEKEQALKAYQSYEISAYGTMRTFASELDLDDVADLLQDTLDEEGNADKKLTKIAEGGLFKTGINLQANEPTPNKPKATPKAKAHPKPQAKAHPKPQAKAHPHPKLPAKPPAKPKAKPQSKSHVNKPIAKTTKELEKKVMGHKKIKSATSKPKSPKGKK